MYISFYGASPTCAFTLARDHYATEEHIRASGLRFTFLGDNLYADFLPPVLATALRAGRSTHGSRPTSRSQTASSPASLTTSPAHRSPGDLAGRTAPPRPGRLSPLSCQFRRAVRSRAKDWVTPGNWHRSAQRAWNRRSARLHRCGRSQCRPRRSNNLCAATAWPARLTDVPIRRMTGAPRRGRAPLGKLGRAGWGGGAPGFGAHRCGVPHRRARRRSGPGAGEDGGAIAAADKADDGLDNAGGTLVPLCDRA